MARGLLPAGILATALLALLAFAPFASAAPDPVGTGTTTVTLNQGFTKSLQNKGVSVERINPTKLKGKKATFNVSGGSIDPLTGLGELTLGGGLKFKAGKATAPVKALVLNTATKSLTAKVAGKKMKFASVAGWSFARNGFGVNLTIKKLKLTGSAASKLNTKLGYSGKEKAFVSGRLLGTSASETQPTTVVVQPGGNMAMAVNASLFEKLTKVKVGINVIPPTVETTKAPSPIYALPISGGTISPTGTNGILQTAGGLKMTQELPTGPDTSLLTNITLGAFYVDLVAKTVSVEVVAESNASKDLNLGNIGRSSIGDLTLTGGTVTADPVTRTVTVQNATVTLQPIAASVLNGFVKVYEGYLEALKAPEAQEQIVSGAPLATIAFTAQTQ